MSGVVCGLPRSAGRAIPGSGGIHQPEYGSAWHFGQVVATGHTGDNGEFELFFHQPSCTGINVPGSFDNFMPTVNYGLPGKQWIGSTTATNA